MHGCGGRLGPGQAFQRGVGLPRLALTALGGSKDEQRFRVVGDRAKNFGGLTLGERGGGEQGDGLADGFREGGGGQAGVLSKVRKEECSFSKKRTKKLLFMGVRCRRLRDSTPKKFFASFFQKRSSSFLPSFLPS
jgi:hypothetical protein